MGSIASARVARLSWITGIALLVSCRGANGAHSEARPVATPLDRQASAARDHVACSSGGADESMHWRGTGKAIEVRAQNGAVHATPSTDGTIDIFATRRDGASHFRPARLRVIERDGLVIACVVAASHARDEDDERDESGERNKRNDDDDNDEGCTGDAEDEGKIELDVRVPKGVRFAGWTANGAVEATHLDADVEAHAQNGSIVLDTTGVARASTVNGSIAAKIGAHRWDGTLSLETVNGHVRVDLPGGVGARLSAETVHGKIGIGMKLADAHVEDTRVEGLIGGGGGKLRLRSVNGAIDVRSYD